MHYKPGRQIIRGWDAHKNPVKMYTIPISRCVGICHTHLLLLLSGFREKKMTLKKLLYKSYYEINKVISTKYSITNMKNGENALSTSSNTELSSWKGVIL